MAAGCLALCSPQEEAAGTSVKAAYTYFVITWCLYQEILKRLFAGSLLLFGRSQSVFSVTLAPLHLPAGWHILPRRGAAFHQEDQPASHRYLP